MEVPLAPTSPREELEPAGLRPPREGEPALPGALQRRPVPERHRERPRDAEPPELHCDKRVAVAAREQPAPAAHAPAPGLAARGAAARVAGPAAAGPAAAARARAARRHGAAEHLLHRQRRGRRAAPGHRPPQHLVRHAHLPHPLADETFARPELVPAPRRARRDEREGLLHIVRQRAAEATEAAAPSEARLSAEGAFRVHESRAQPREYVDRAGRPAGRPPG